MLGLMQHHPLLISSLLYHAASAHRSAQIVSLMPGAPAHRCGYPDIARRARQVSQALGALGIREGDRVGTMAWNDHRHLELFFGVSGMGSVLHTVNPRMIQDQITYTINHAEDQVLFFDVGFAPLVARLAPQLACVRHFVAMTDRKHMPEQEIPSLLCFEDLIAPRDAAFDWPTLDERSASSLCYTSGTTGNPKGVLYSHRSTLLHASLVCMADGLGLAARDMLFMASPMFHVNAWGMPYACALSGASMVLPGSALDASNIYSAMKTERVTVAAGVPTVWMGLQQHVAAEGLKPREDLCLERLLIGGAAVPRAVVETFAAQFGASVLHVWGMTETSPLATLANPLRKHEGATPEQRTALQGKQGRVPYGAQIKLTDDDGNTLPHDGQAAGHLMVRGHWIASSYFRADGGAIVDGENWFDTGDIATIDADGFMQITDRAKDLIKSGGEWISSIDLENAAVGHPSVAEAAVIAMAHDKWQERPLMLVLRRPGLDVSKAELLEFLANKVAKWWLPDDILFVGNMPHTATGKLQKMKLREIYGDHKLADG